MTHCFCIAIWIIFKVKNGLGGSYVKESSQINMPFQFSLDGKIENYTVMTVYYINKNN